MPGFRPTSIRVHPAVEGTYAGLERAARWGKKPESAIWKSFTTALSRIRADAQWGEIIPHAHIPQAFRRRYIALANLYCVDLAGFRRCFYTIEGRVVVFLDLVDHAQYDKWFGKKSK